MLPASSRLSVQMAPTVRITEAAKQSTRGVKKEDESGPQRRELISACFLFHHDDMSYHDWGFPASSVIRT